MRYVRERLERIPTLYLLAYVTIADVTLFAGIVPFELYCRSAMGTHRTDPSFLLAILGANILLILFLLSAMCAASVLLGRGVRRAARVTLPVLRRQPSRGRTIPSAR